MSVLKVAAIQNPSAATAAITLDANGGALIGGQAAYARNLVYNGAMQVSQRSASVASITANGYYTADRWLASLTSIGTWTQSVESDAPTGSGFRNSLKMLCTTADAAPAASDQLSIRQLLEGQDVQRIAKGTSDAQQLSLSFWVKANVTGTYVVELFDADNTRQVSESYTVSASATWEKKTIALPADTTGAFDNDNAGSLICLFWLAAGSTFTSGTLNTSWASSTNADRAVGQTNLAAATNNYWQVTGVQLEVGPVATPFEFKSFGQELRECQRYFFKTFAQGTAPAQNVASSDGALFGGPSVSNISFIATQVFPVTMRGAPTVTTFSPNAASANWTDQGGAIPTVAVLSGGQAAVSIRGTTATSPGGAHSIHLTASAEL
jgi:hypothetical protein